MDVRELIQRLLHSLSALDFVESVEVQSEVFIVRARIVLIKDRFADFYYNGKTDTWPLALIIQEKRIWGVDCDKVRGWHVHPLENPNGHLPCAPMGIEEMIEALSNAWQSCT